MLKALFITLIVISCNIQKSSGQTHKSCLVPDESRTVEDMRVTLREKNPYMDLYRSQLCKIINLALEGSTDRILRNRVLNSKDSVDMGWILDHTVIYDHASFSPGLFINSYRVGDMIVFEDIHGIKSDWFVFKEKDIVLVWGKTLCGNLQKRKRITVKQPVDSVIDELKVMKKVPQPASSGNTNNQQVVTTTQTVVVQRTKKVPQPTSSNPCEKCTPCKDSTSMSTTAKVPQPQSPTRTPRRRVFVRGTGIILVSVAIYALYYSRVIWATATKTTPPPTPVITGHGTGGTGNGGNGSGGTGNGGNGNGGTGNGGNGGGGSGNGGNGSGGTGNHPWWRFW